MSDFTGKHIVVTGGTQGLGAAIATLFAERGAAGIMICGRNAENGAQVAQRIRDETNCDIRFVQADLTQVAACEAVIAAADEAFGTIDTLVNAAALTDRGDILNTTPELYDKIMAVNLRAPFFLMQGAAKIMLREGVEGSIVNIASMLSMSGQPSIAAYSASKGGLATLTKNTAAGLLRNRIRVNGINVGWMMTEGEDAIQKAYHGADEKWMDTAAAALPFGRLIDPAEVARAVAFLASAESGLMTGSMVNFDQTIWGAYAPQPMPDTK